MDAEKETKEISLILINSDALRSHYFGLRFDKTFETPYPNISNSKFFGQIQLFTVQNNNVTNIRLIAKPSSLEPLMEFAEVDFPFEDGKVYTLQILQEEGKRREIKITEHKQPIED